jgi:serine/threonine protein kinase
MTEQARDRRRVSRYLVISKIAAGGMGAVYKAFDPELDRRVAMSEVHDGAVAATSAAARLVPEAKALAQLSHPNVVAVHDVGAFGDDVFIAMALVDGQTLRAWLRAQTRSLAKTPWARGRSHAALSLAQTAVRGLQTCRECDAGEEAADLRAWLAARP